MARAIIKSNTETGLHFVVTDRNYSKAFLTKQAAKQWRAAYQRYYNTNTPQPKTEEHARK